MSRRDALKTLGAGLSLASLGGLAGRAMAAAPTPAAPADVTADQHPVSGWQLPKLPYAYDALEPHIDARTMEIHYTKHHQAYITNARKLLETRPDLLARSPVNLLKEISIVPEGMRTGVRNNVGGHVNHSFFWTILAPSAGGAPSNTLGEAITKQFGSFDDFRKLFADAAMKRFGSGWAWLVAKDGKLQILSTANQDSPLSDGAAPLIGIDVWEHAYYLHYQNRRADYLAAFWNVVNWPQADTYYQATLTA
ncbi:MAG TPA: superoxide dismutase [Candidatus Didemnitutus sp.]|nr:superoxide dismutase [Candidatus Didemnitutus sp.]